MRDLETVSIALETAETGHLVFGTLHTNTAPSTVDRIIDQFPADRQSQIRIMLSESLKAVVTQTLCKKVGGGRVAAREVLLANSAVSNLIREGKTFQLASTMQTGRGQGMVTLNDALLDLVRKKLVLPEEALSKSVAKAELRKALDASGLKLAEARRSSSDSMSAGSPKGASLLRIIITRCRFSCSSRAISNASDTMVRTSALFQGLRMKR
jgi:twitching motility protein PilT